MPLIDKLSLLKKPWKDPKVSFTTKIPLATFNAMQSHALATKVSMAEFVRDAVAEKLRRNRLHLAPIP